MLQWKLSATRRYSMKSWRCQIVRSRVVIIFLSAFFAFFCFFCFFAFLLFWYFDLPLPRAKCRGFEEVVEIECNNSITHKSLYSIRRLLFLSCECLELDLW